MAVRRRLNHYMNQAKRDVDYLMAGYSPKEIIKQRDYKDTASTFGTAYASELEKEARHQESLDNAKLDYDFDEMEIHHEKRYHSDCKAWLDIIKRLDLPIQIESCIGRTSYHDGDFNWTTDEGRVWRFRDLETRYCMDFQTGERELTKEEVGCINGKNVHVKFIWALPQDQQGYFVMNKSVRRCTRILFQDGYDFCDGWCSHFNQIRVRQGRCENWRAEKVRIKDRYGCLSKNDGIRLLAMYLRAGWIIVGDKKEDKMIAYISPLLYRYMTKDDPDALKDELKYARNFSYEN